MRLHLSTVPGHIRQKFGIALIMHIQLGENFLGVRWIRSHSIAQLVVMCDRLMELFVQHWVLEVVPDLPVFLRAHRWKLVLVTLEILDNFLFAVVSSNAS